MTEIVVGPVQTNRVFAAKRIRQAKTKSAKAGVTYLLQVT